VFNGIVTNHFWTTMPWWVTTLLTLALGGVVTLVVATFSPVPASILALITVAGYALFNGLFLFDYMDLIVGMAGPFFVMATIWAAITVIKYFLEIAERERITRRFRSYVDPQLVNYIEEHPEQSSLTGQIKEMTVVFTDLEGFTTLSERLKEKTVPMLSAYMGEMVPIIRANRGYVNKFLGDGIMFFYNSPLPNDAHAFDAVKTILQMKTAMIGFNKGLLKQNLPTLRMRAGMTTGEMVVGDAGPADGSDYTVLGDTVNLSARLEGANKVVGTVKRTVELLGGKIAFRPVARIQVKGKEEAVETYEPICLAGEETEEQKKIIAHSKRVYDAYVAGEFAECKKAAEAMIAELGEGKFAKLYLGIAKEYLEKGKPQGFDGRIALDSK
jgi:adenylate cyclase